MRMKMARAPDAAADSDAAGMGNKTTNDQGPPSPPSVGLCAELRLLHRLTGCPSLQSRQGIEVLRRVFSSKGLASDFSGLSADSSQ